jgi:glycosyltransferase involved in cell wall biosynthesis
VALEHLHSLGQLDPVALAGRLAGRPVFVSAATFEPFGLAVLEAAASGCPLVLSDIPTFRELWDGAAIFVSPHDVAGFAAAILECVEDLELRHRMGEAARARAGNYSASRMTSATAAHYRALVAERLAA